MAFDPADPGFLADPYPALAAVRATDPAPMWEGRVLLASHAEVRAALRDRRFGRGPDPLAAPSAADPRWAPFWEVEARSLLSLEPPDHTRVRRLVSAAFTNRAVTAMRPVAADLAHTLLADLAVQADFDLLADFAQPYSIGVIGALLGVPAADHRRLLDWSHAMVKMYELGVSDDAAAAATAAAAAFREYVLALAARRLADPGDDLVTALVHAAVDGERLTEDELVSTVVLLLNAGHEATVNTLGNGVVALLRAPEEMALLRNGDVLVPDAVEELLRFDAPLQLFERWVLDPEGAAAGGHALAHGGRVALLLGAANRDPAVFASPDALDLRREAGGAGHVGFGGGIHLCLGAPLARLELDVALTALLAAFPDLALAEEPERAPTFVLRGYRSVRVTPTARNGRP